MQKTIYISDNDQGLFAKAQEMLGESSTSSTIVAALKYAIEHKGKDAAAYELKDGEVLVKLYGEELILFNNEKDRNRLPIFRAFKTKSGKIIVSVETGAEHKLLRYKDCDDFYERGFNDPSLSDRDVGVRIYTILRDIPIIETID